MRIDVNLSKLDTEEDALVIAKRWYTEQRGRRLGNTAAWDELNNHQRMAVLIHVDATLRTFRAVMAPEPTPVEKRETHVAEARE